MAADEAEADETSDDNNINVLLHNGPCKNEVKADKERKKPKSKIIQDIMNIVVHSTIIMKHTMLWMKPELEELWQFHSYVHNLMQLLGWN